MLFVDGNKQLRDTCEEVTKRMGDECDGRVGAMTKTVSHLEGQCKELAECGEELRLQVGDLFQLYYK